jgi:hypothetical protein
LTELKEYSNKEQNKIRKIMKDMKEEFNKEINPEKKSHGSFRNEKLKSPNKNSGEKSC